MALNAQGIGTSALESYQRHLRSLGSEEAEAVLDQIDALDEQIEEVSGPFVLAEGSGLYVLHSKLNHSCEPNAEIRFPYNDFRLQVVALRDISPGEEVVIDYLQGEGDCCDDEEDIEDDGPCSSEAHHNHGYWRKETLKRYYLFECSCPRCVGKK